MRGLTGFAALLFLAVMPSAPVWAQEWIYSFDSVIRVNEDASLTVTETIAVEARGQEIKRGIYRDFPTVYPQPDGSRPEAGFEVVEVLRNGEPEPWFTEGNMDGVRVYFGREDAFLEPGRHVYKLTYRTTRQLRFFADHDELYWNVNGNGWRFNTNKVSATVFLPSGARMLDRTAYSGYIDETREDWRAGEDAEGNPTFESTMAFPPRMGLTIVVSFPKGHVAYPTGRQKLIWLFMDNLHWMVAAGILLAVLFYYLLVWWRVGRDPRGGAVIPRYLPPEGISPSAARYLTRMGFDRKSAGAATVSLAVNGRLKIREDSEGEYRLVEVDSADSGAGLTGEESAFLRELFLGGNSVGLDRADSNRLIRAIDALEHRLGDAFDGTHFSRNWAYAMAGVAQSVVVLFAFVSAAMMANIVEGIFVAIGILVFLILLNVLFRKLLYAPTRLGRDLLDEIAGFRMYLETAEEARLNLVNPPGRTPELFERYLPYAMALDVENEWAGKFQDVLSAATAAGASPYRPGWYDNRSGLATNFATAAFARGLGGGLAGSFASATRPSGSSGSGFSSGSRGGSSGGGGGGGGGGGW
jgi:uncharacterized membrane protein YgcG